MDVLSTAFALFALCACGFLAWQAHGFSRDARDAARELQKSQGKIASHTLTLDAHHAHLRRLEGRIAQMKQGRKPPEEFVEGRDYNVIDAPAVLNGELDPELAAELALQSAPAVSPGKQG